MNKAQAESLFAQHAVLFGSRDGIPERAAVALLGCDAVAFAKRMGTSSPVTLWNGYGNGSYTANYLTLAGFLIAVTYNNVTDLQRQTAT